MMSDDTEAGDAGEEGGLDLDAIARASADAMWANDPASAGLGMLLLDVGPGYALMTMEITAAMTNGHDTAHGGFIFTLADSAFAFACNSYNRSTVASSCEIRFLAPTRLGDVLVAEAVERSRSGRDGVYDITVKSGKIVVAEFVGRSKEIRGTLYPEED